MGQKVNPVGMRVGINKNWNSRWFASNKDYSNFLIEDNKIRKFIEKNLDKQAFLSHIEIERKKTNKGYVVTVQIFVARPGVVIGQDGVNINNLKKSLEKLINNTNLKVDVVEFKQPSLDAKIVSLQIAKQLEERASYPIHIILEEAHRYVQNDNDINVLGYNIFDRITKEGRKYGVILGLITQRPSELSNTALSQCSNFIAFRMFHPEDIKIIKNITSSVSDETIDKLKNLTPGTAITFGTAFKIPLISKLELPNPMPESTSVDITSKWF